MENLYKQETATEQLELPLAGDENLPVATNKPGIDKMSIKHDAILDFVLCNPEMPLSEVALKFRVSQPWLSCIIHSDAFQAAKKERQADIRSGTIASIQEKTAGAAGLMLEQLAEKTSAGGLTNEQLITGSDKLLGRLGFGSKGNAGPSPDGGEAPAVSIQVINAARDRIGETEIKDVTPTSEVIENEEDKS